MSRPWILSGGQSYLIIQVPATPRPKTLNSRCVNDVVKQSTSSMSFVEVVTGFSILPVVDLQVGLLHGELIMLSCHTDHVYLP